MRPSLSGESTQGCVVVRPERVHIFEVVILRVTEKAVKVRYGNLDEDVWLPKSQIREPDSEELEEGEAEIKIPEWLALEKGFL